MTPAEEQDLKALQREVSRLSTLIETEGLRCPYREDIAKSANNRDRINRNSCDINELEKRVTALDIGLARLVVMMTGAGGLGGAIVAVVNAMAKGG